MKKNRAIYKLFLYLSMVALTACNNETPQVIESTRLVPQTVVVTRVVPVTTVSTLESPTPTVTPQPTVDISYYNAVVVVVQYYTLIDHGLYKEAYQLLSPSNRNPDLEKYVADMENSFNVAKIITVQPVYKSAQHQSGIESSNKKIFILDVYLEGAGGMAGSVANGIHTYFVTVIQEDDEWKIHSVNTSP